MEKPKRQKRSREPEELSQLLAGASSGKTHDRLFTDDGRDLAAVLMGRRGGLKGGRARAEALSPEKRREIARKAAEARWGKK